MTPEMFLVQFGRITDSPNGVQKLRELILDLAVRGRLVSQDPNEVSALQLWKESNQVESHRLTGWCTVPVELLGIFNRNKTIEPSKEPSKSFQLWSVPSFATGRPEEVRGAGIGSSKIVVSEGDILFSKINPRLKRVWIVGKSNGLTQIASSEWIRIANPVIYPEFAKVLLRESSFIEAVCSSETGMGSLTRAKPKEVRKIKVFIPPFEEQKRIVAKVDQLMTLCDRLEEQQKQWVEIRGKTAASALDALVNSENAEAFEANWQRIAANFDRLINSTETIKALRATILDLAVRGKLAPQDQNGESAKVLLDKIRPEKDRLVREGKFNSLGSEALCHQEDVPFSLPANWTWCWLDEIAAIARGGSPRPIKSYITNAHTGLNWIKIGDSQRGSIYINETKEKIRPEGLSKTREVFPGDLILSNSMSFGYPYILNIQGCIHDGWLVIRLPEHLVNKLYIYHIFLSNFARKAFTKAAAGAVVQNLNADKVRLLKIPLPPLEEQKRIVAKIDQLMAVCDRLEAQLAARDALGEKLAASFTHHLLAA